MAVSLTYLPSRNSDVLDYASQVHDLISDTGFTPSSVGLTSGDVTDLGTKLANAQDAFVAAAAAKANAQSKTEALTGPGAAMDQLVQDLRDLANKARASAATDDALASIGISRRAATNTPTATPTAPAIVKIDGGHFSIVWPGINPFDWAIQVQGEEGGEWDFDHAITGTARTSDDVGNPYAVRIVGRDADRNPVTDVSNILILNP